MIFNIITILVLLSLDFLSKWAIHTSLPVEKIIPLNNTFSISYLQTTVGYSLDNELFSMLSLTNSASMVHAFQYTLSIIVLITMYYILKQPALNDETIDSKLPRISCLLIIAGVLGNMLNLIYNGYVVDFIRYTSDTKFVLVFNFADIYLYLSPLFLVITIFYLFFREEPKNVN